MEKTHLRINGNFIQSIMKDGRIQYLVHDGASTQYLDTYQAPDGTEYEPINKQYVSTGCIVLPLAPDFNAEPIDVWLSVRKFWADNILLDNLSIEVLTAFTYFSWFYDSTETAPYLLVIGDLGTAKTRVLDIAKMLCFNATMLGTAVTAANIFRLQNVTKGTLLVDEFERRQSNRASDITQILNSGYRNGGVVLRCEPKTNEPIPYDTYGPKIIATRSMPDDDALVSRCFILGTKRKTVKELKANNIPLDLNNKHRKQAALIRSKLFGLRLRQVQVSAQNNKLYFKSQRPRDKQLLVSMLSVQPEAIQSILAEKVELALALSRYTPQLELESNIAKLLCAKINKTVSSKTNSMPITITINEIKAHLAKGYQKRYYNKTIANACRKMGFELERYNKGMRLIIYSADTMDDLMEKYVLEKAA